ncbi:MAG: type IV secretion system protein DotC [Gammaproteobacteria bacterium]|jgi:defect-in-organelle-trafficking protein DotC|nr:type IV secretion system protein DotC [Gammaproteobacteria bacterium]
MFSNKKSLLLACTSLVLFGCSGSDELQDGVEIHKDAIRKVALSYGAQSGLKWQSQKIADTLNHYSRELDTIYDFNFLLMYGKVLPPVIEESYLTYNIANAKEVRLADKEVKIIRQARFVSNAPTWHDYIDISYEKPKPPPLALVPQSKEELAIWQSEVEEGWKQGVAQAKDNFSVALRYLNRDFIGMTAYYTLYAQNMISSPVTTSTKLGITGDENTMRIGDQVLRITALSKLNIKNPDHWNPVISALEIEKQPRKNGSTAPKS